MDRVGRESFTNLLDSESEIPEGKRVYILCRPDLVLPSMSYLSFLLPPRV